MQDWTITPQGVLFTTQARAQTYAEYSDRDVVQVENGWLARNREMNTGAMPTRRGDVIVRRTGLVFNIWTVTTDAAEEPDAGVVPYQTWSWPNAADSVRNVVAETKGRVFLTSNKGWVMRETI